MCYLVVILVLLISLILQQGSAYDYVIKFHETQLDHFNIFSNRTFKLRYLSNDTYWSKDKKDAPIFFYTGNEGDITTFALNTGFMWEIAPEFNALIIFAEHRYYGQSLPFGNKSKEPENVGYLSSSQALMDYVELIAYIKASNKAKQEDHPVVVFGGSYGGMLAAWMRMKYPATVVGAVASSAPIWQFTGMTPCNAFYRVLTSAFTSASHHCSQNIRKSWSAINNITSTDEGKAWLSSEWRLCSPLNTSSDVAKLKNYLIDAYTSLAMVNYPYPAEFLAPLPAYPVKVFCKSVSKDGLYGKELLSKLFEGVSVFFNFTGHSDCFDYSNAYGSIGDDIWNYQACSEMVMPMCTNGEHDMFEPSKWNFTSYSTNCYNVYKIMPQQFLVQNIYGGKDISTASNIIFSNGLLDPWYRGGVLRNVSETAVAVIIPESAHHLDLRATNSDDPMSITLARRYYRYTINKWISDRQLN